MDGDYSRRNFLRSSSVGMLAVGSAGLAGCTSSLPIVGDDGVSDAALDSWLVELPFTDLFQDDELASDREDAELEGHEQRDRSFDAVVPQAVLDNEAELTFYWPLQQGSGQRDRVGVTATELDWQLTQSVTWDYEFTYTYTGWSEQEETRERTAALDIGTFAGSFDPATIEENLNDWADGEFSEDGDDGLESAGEHEGFDCYETDRMAFGVSDEYVLTVEGNSYLDSTTALEAAIDAHVNAEARWTETDNGEAVLSSFDSGHLAEATVHETASSRVASRLEQNGMLRRREDIDELSSDELDDRKESIDFGDWEEGLAGTATAYEFDGDSTELQAVYLYESESDADADALEDYADSNRDIGDEFATLEEYSIETEGRTLVLTGSIRTRSLLG